MREQYNNAKRSHTVDPEITTYILVGYDENGAFTDPNTGGLNGLRARYPNAEFLSYNDYHTVVAAKAQITKKPYRLVVACHSNHHGECVWAKPMSELERLVAAAKDEPAKDYTVSHETIFSGLPEGLETIEVTSCYGGMAIHPEALAVAPPGTIVFAQVDRYMPSYAVNDILLGREATNQDLITILLETVDNSGNADNIGEYEDAFQRIPGRVGIGGDPPIMFNAKAVYRGIADNPDALKAAIARVHDRADVQNHLDPYLYNEESKALRERMRAAPLGPEELGKTVARILEIHAQLQTEATQQLHQRIDALAEQYAKGEIHFDAGGRVLDAKGQTDHQATKIIVMLNLAYWHESGDMARDIENTKKLESERTPSASPKETSVKFWRRHGQFLDQQIEEMKSGSKDSTWDLLELEGDEDKNKGALRQHPAHDALLNQAGITQESLAATLRADNMPLRNPAASQSVSNNGRFY